MTKHRVNHSALPVILYALILMLACAGCFAGGSSPRAVRPFDYYIDCTTKEDIEYIKEQPFTGQVFPFTLMIFRRPGYNSPMEGQIAVLAAPSFEGLEASPYHPGVMKKEDPAVMQDPSRNPILIDDTLAKAEKLSPGDTF